MNLKDYLSSSKVRDTGKIDVAYNKASYVAYNKAMW